MRPGFNINFSSDNARLTRKAGHKLPWRQLVIRGEVNVTACFNGPYSNYNLTGSYIIKVEIDYQPSFARYCFIFNS